MSVHCNPVRIRGVDYPSQSAAARALGVDLSTVTKALAAGKADGIGLRRNKGGNPGKPCVYRGRAYPSICAAAHDWGVSERTVRKAATAWQDMRMAA